jgi:hypothetical protein
MGVVLRVVRRDDERGKVLLPGKPPLVVLREHRRGGMVDTTATPRRFVAPSERPVVWYCSEHAEDSILHGEGIANRLLVYGAMGAGKTTTMCQWLGFRALEFTGSGGELGATAPTNDRSIMIQQAIGDMWPRAWWEWKERTRTFTLANGITVRLVSTHQTSKAEGSRVQGWSWLACASDEVQDSLHVDGDIEARGRDAPRGRYLRFTTATAKDDTQWRAWRDRVLTTSVWSERRMSGPDSPFTWPSFWSDLAQTLSPREYQRKVLALDVGPERMVYVTWSRAHSVRPVPQIGAVDITREVLSAYGPNFTCLVGHDPGTLFDVSLILKAYRLPGQRRHVWFVVDEITTEQTTAEQHARTLLNALRTRWSTHRLDMRGRPLDGSELALIRADPSGDSDKKTDKAVYTVMANHGLVIRPAAYAPAPRTGGIIGQSKHGRVPKKTGIEMVVRLLCDATGERRLFVACDDSRQPCAPRLVEAIERSEFDLAGDAETERKDAKHDRSHWCAALRYALFDLERPRYGQEVAS